MTAGSTCRRSICGGPKRIRTAVPALRGPCPISIFRELDGAGVHLLCRPSSDDLWPGQKLDVRKPDVEFRSSPSFLIVGSCNDPRPGRLDLPQRLFSATLRLERRAALRPSPC